MESLNLLFCGYFWCSMRARITLQCNKSHCLGTEILCKIFSRHALSLFDKNSIDLINPLREQSKNIIDSEQKTNKSETFNFWETFLIQKYCLFLSKWQKWPENTSRKGGIDKKKLPRNAIHKAASSHTTKSNIATHLYQNTHVQKP